MEELTNVEYTKKILDMFITIKQKYFLKPKRKQRTIIVKKEFAKLGHNLKLKCYGNGLDCNARKEIGNNFRNREFLYDFQWYTENGDYITKRLVLTLECEWDYQRKEDKAPYSAVKFDFQKLVVAKSEIKVMISKLKTKEDLSFLKSYYCTAINTFGKMERETYLMFAICQRDRKIYYMQIDANLKEWSEI